MRIFWSVVSLLDTYMERLRVCYWDWNLPGHTMRWAIPHKLHPPPISESEIPVDNASLLFFKQILTEEIFNWSLDFWCQCGYFLKIKVKTKIFVSKSVRVKGSVLFKKAWKFNKALLGRVQFIRNIPFYDVDWELFSEIAKRPVCRFSAVC